MAPTKSVHPMLSELASRHTISTRSRAIANCGQTKDVSRTKRKADCSPSKENKANKRTAFGDRNVNVNDLKIKALDDKHKVGLKSSLPVKKVTVQVKTLTSVKTILKPRQNENLLAPPPAPGHKIVTRATGKTVIVPDQTAQKPKEVLKDSTNANKANKRLSNEFEKTEETLYCTALEDVAKKHQGTRSEKSTESSPCNNGEQASANNISLVAEQIETRLNLGNHEVPYDVEDYDKENWDDIFQVSHYAMDIFNYLKDREASFQIPDYMDRQICLTRWMRSLLVDWMVEIQESFELNHETLYLGVKLVDMYLSRMTVGKETLQLVGAAAMFIASKYDERIPPSVDDFLYICDGAYSRRELIRMEMNLLKICGFDLGIPISYRFLRRYARCAKISMPVLTLARYILEYSLMDYKTVTIRDSKLASAALYLALKMKKISGWTPTLEFYTGYSLMEIMQVVFLLNNGISQPPKSQLMTVRNKYSHKIFFEVARTPLVKNEDL
ncbi:G2/mitotic-specific cyclin-B3 isoform X2 [Anoplophora glabripennis]|uniref:G2/mitotic-specific cyclin-B3 isoform X2 n=1 Tax=Anoplophora glabripennis TaxID=217634 RepID=UPI000874BDEE|nr:G2/mitotic-specific cyclin-B3 isoform X2 [Anoplophora glabripennis]